MAKRPSREQRLKERMLAAEAARVTIIHCRDMLGPLRERLEDVFDDGSDPHGMKRSWLRSADANLALLIEAVVERQEFL